MDQTVLNFGMTASVIIGYFISISLITISFYKSHANNYLSGSLFLIATLTLLELLAMISTNIAFVVLSNFRLDFLFAATLCTYFLIQIKHPLLKNGHYKWIYLPFFCSVVFEIPIYLLKLHGSFFEFLAFFIRDSASIVFNTFFIFWGRYLVKNATTISEDKRRWLLRLNCFVLCIIISWILTRVEFYIFNSTHTFYLLWLLLALFLWWVLYYGVFRLQIIAQKEELHAYLVSKKNVAHPKRNPVRQPKSMNISEVITQLYSVMEEEELYKNPLLSRLDLAVRLGTSEGYLSQIINQKINKSVIQFVNEYRIKMAKNLLHDPRFDKYSVEAIGMEAGFKSKSAFYTVFKTSLEMSPGAYRKLQERPDSF